MYIDLIIFVFLNRYQERYTTLNENFKFETEMN